MSTPVNLLGTGPTLIAQNTPVPSRVSSPPAIRAAANNPNSFPYQALAKDLESLSKQTDTLHSTLTGTPPTITQLLITNQSGQVVAAVGNTTYEGVYYVNYFSEIHVANPLLTNNPEQAVFNANADGSVTIGQNGFISVLDPYEGIAAYIGTQDDSNIITGAADNGAGLIRLLVPGHTLITGNPATVRGMQYAGVPNATGQWTVTVVDASHVDLQKSVFAGAYTPPPPVFGIDATTPTIDRVLQVSGAASSAGLIRIQTSIAHTYVTGDRVNVQNVGGVPNATGQWTIKVPDTTHFDLVGSTFAGAYTSGGTVLRFFAGMLAQTFATGPSFVNYTLRAFADGSLRINNATISLTGSSGNIVLDPTGPSIVLTSPAGQITLDATGPDILLTNTANAASLQLTSNPPALILKDLLGVIVAQIAVNGSGHGTVVLNGPTINNATLTGTGGITGSAVMRNAAGTGTSTLTYVNGFVTNWVP